MGACVGVEPPQGSGRQNITAGDFVAVRSERLTAKLGFEAMEFNRNRERLAALFDKLNEICGPDRRIGLASGRLEETNRTGAAPALEFVTGPLAT